MRVLTTILLVLMLSSCSAMLLGSDVTPAEKSDTEDDEKSKKER